MCGSNNQNFIPVDFLRTGNITSLYKLYVFLNYSNDHPTAMQEKSYNKNLVTIISAVAATGGLLFGFDIGVISGAIPFFQQDFHLSNSMVENITTAGLAGAVLGAVFTGRLSDIFGRKKTILTAAIISIIC